MSEKQDDDLLEVVQRASDAYNEAKKATTSRARSRAETRFYANCETIYWLIKASMLELKEQRDK